MSDAVSAAAGRLAAERGWPALEDVTPLSRSRRHANWRLRFVDGSSRLLRVLTDVEGGESLSREAAACERLRASELPVPRQYELLEEAWFGAPAAVVTWLDGASAEGVVDAYPELLESLCRDAGALMVQLERETVSPYGMSVRAARFTATRPSWSLEYYGRIADWYTRAHAHAADPGPLLAVLLQRLERALPALDRASRFCLVHGDLGPSNLLLAVEAGAGKGALPSYQITGVVDWEFATLGDPLLELAMPLELPVGALARVLDGYGDERVRALLADRDASTRLEVYAIGRVVQYLAVIVAQHPVASRPWSIGMAYAVGMASARVADGYAQRTLEAALAVDRAEPLAIEDEDEVELLGRALALRLLARAACAPLLDDDAIDAWLGGLACALHGVANPDEGWIGDGEQFAASLPPATSPSGFEPLRDRARWLAGMDARLAALGSDRATFAFWLAAQSMMWLADNPRVTTWPVRNHTLRGVQTLVELLARRPSVDEPRIVLLDSLLGLVAEQGLARLLQREVRGAAQVARLGRLREAWEDLTVFGSGAPAAVDPGALHTAEGAWTVPVTLLAIGRADGLGVPADQLVGAICGAAEV